MSESKSVVRINNYYTNPRLSNSLLSAMTNPRLFKLKKDRPELFENDDKTALRIGSAVDCLLTAPDRWDEEFIVVDVSKPYGLMGTFVQHLPKNLSKNSDREEYITAYEKSGYKMSLDWVIEKFWNTPDAVEYYKWTKDSPADLWVLSKDEYATVVKCTELILANKFTYPYFINNYLDQELLHQVEIYFEFEGLEFKALLDGVLIDHTNKTIQPFDLKTTSKSVYDFKNSFLTYGYYRQCALYEYALKQKESPVYTYIEEGYEVLDFVFIVVETKPYSYHPAVIYKTTKEDRIAGMQGGVVDNRHWPGLVQLVENYKWHLQNDEWDMPADLIQSEGIIDLNCF